MLAGVLFWSKKNMFQLFTYQLEMFWLKLLAELKQPNILFTFETSQSLRS